MSEMRKYTGRDLLAMGCEEGPLLGILLQRVNATAHTPEQVKSLILEARPNPVLTVRDQPAPCQYNITADNPTEAANVEAVKATMDVVLRTPCVVEAAVMPDACPAGPVGTIPVGGVVAAKNAIIPGMHSADICCSLMVTVFDQASPSEILDAAYKSTHFGPGGREDFRKIAMPGTLAESIDAIQYPGLRDIARHHLGTQGDGNHFVYVGTVESSGKTALITHHGSRGVGARLYKQGIKLAQRWRKKLAPDTLSSNAWIPFDTDDGREYWQALQAVREWTKHNHTCLHEMTGRAVGAEVSHRFWNEHNFVFREQVGDEDIFWHAKGATPIHNAFMPDTDGVQIIPLNMAQPVLLVKGERNSQNRGFAPHGAGRNISRTKHKKNLAGQSEEDIFVTETAGLDVRFYCGKIDLSELPSAYKNAQSVMRDMRDHNLADVVDQVIPYGSIMAGDWQRDVSWKQLREQKRRLKRQRKRSDRRAAKQNMDRHL